VVRELRVRGVKIEELRNGNLNKKRELRIVQKEKVLRLLTQLKNIIKWSATKRECQTMNFAISEICNGHF
jgi:hypothetical protein